MTRRARFAFEARDRRGVGADGQPFGVHVGNLRTVEVYDARDDPSRDYLGSLTMTGDQHAALLGELLGAAVVRELHRPCHGDGDPSELCRELVQHRSGPQPPVPLCRECGKPYPCPTTEVLPS